MKSFTFWDKSPRKWSQKLSLRRMVDSTDLAPKFPCSELVVSFDKQWYSHKLTIQGNFSTVFFNNSYAV